VIFLFVSGIFTFQLGGFFESRQASLQSFFTFHPWLYLFLVPAVSMRLWSEERKSGTIEMVDQAHKPIARYAFVNAWPTKVELPDFEASSNELAIETIEITHEGLRLVDP